MMTSNRAPPDETATLAAPRSRCAAGPRLSSCAGMNAVTSGLTCCGALTGAAPKMSPPAEQQLK